MNQFLTPLTQVIHNHKGTIDKYMGDAIMAFWGAPLRDERHGLHAVQAALDMIRALGEVQEDFKARGWPPIKIGVGLNSGVMSVGNMGSEFRMAYTVLGDAVNLGSRLEGLTKQYGVDIIVSETTKAAAPEYAYRELDRVRVKGKHEPVVIYELDAAGRAAGNRSKGAGATPERPGGLSRAKLDVGGKAVRRFAPSLSGATPLSNLPGTRRPLPATPARCGLGRGVHLPNQIGCDSSPAAQHLIHARSDTRRRFVHLVAGVPGRPTVSCLGV